MIVVLPKRWRLAFLCVMRLYTNICVVYRDSNYREMNTLVQDGIWKGIYTSKLKAGEVISLQNTVNNNI